MQEREFSILYLTRRFLINQASSPPEVTILFAARHSLLPFRGISALYEWINTPDF
jgi:hypothetical protein